MARNAGVAVESNFTNGLVTEATGLNFPENAVTSTDNCVFNAKGVASRRDGFDYEPASAVFVSSVSTEAVCVEYIWEAVAGNGNMNVLVQQIGKVLYFMSIVAGSPISGTVLHTLDLTTYATEPTLLAANPCAFAHGLGRLMVCHPFCTPFFVNYNRGTAAITATPISILTRDFRGLDPRPTGRTNSLTTEEKYNRINQGWTQNLLDQYFVKLTFNPSDYEVWWLYKGPDPDFGTEVFLPPGVVNQVAAGFITRGNSPAPNGAMILTEFYQDRSAASGVPGIPVIASGPYRPSAVAFHAGRVFYSGVNYNEYSSKIYFSQIIERTSQFGWCYQENDPTSQYTPDLLPSDGGVISIPDVGQIVRLWSINNSILVIATNGVWEITGSTGIGFTSIDYTVKKISSVATNSPYSFVNVQGAPFWFGKDGIYAAGAQNDALGIQISNVSDAKIKDFFFDIPENSRYYVKGAYDPKSQIIQWLYRSTAGATLSEIFTYRRVLNFSMKNQAFYPWTLPDMAVKLKGIYAAKGNNVGGDGSTIRYTISNDVTQAWTMAQTYPGQRFDWSTFGGIDYDSNMTSGYKIRGQAIAKAQTNYIRFYNEGPGAFVFYSKWDYKTTSDSNRWSSPQLVEFNDLTDTDTQTRRRKIRGHGLALQVTFQSVGREDFAIVGWGSFDTTNTRP